MAKLGENLPRKKAVKAAPDVRICPACKTPPYPRGYDVVTGKCWFCIFPRG